MGLSFASLFASFFMGSVGLAFFVYGKKELRYPQLLVGLTLMIYPYFVTSPLTVWLSGGVILLGLMLALRLGC